MESLKDIIEEITDEAWEWVNKHHPDASEEQKEKYYNAYVVGRLRGFRCGLKSSIKIIKDLHWV